MANNKTTKCLKRLQNTGTQSKHTTPDNTSTHTRTIPRQIKRQLTTKNNTISHPHNRMQTPTNNPHAQTAITSPIHTPLSRHVQSTQPAHNHAHAHRSLNTLQTGHKHTPQSLNHSIRNMNNTQTPQTQHSTHTPLMHVQTTCHTTRSNQHSLTPPPPLRIPPRSQQPCNTSQNNSTPYLHRNTTYNSTAQQQHRMPPTNSPVNHIPQSITQNIQSQIQNFITRQTHKHHK